MQEWSEDGFIQYLSTQFPPGENVIGIGDDCAVVSAEGEASWLITTDALVEGIHFLKDQAPPHEVGYKTIAVNVSDIVAMGGRPKYAFLSIALPKTVDHSWMLRFIHGIKEACNKWNIYLLGGDTVGSLRDIFLNLTLIGSAKKSCIKYRHTAQPGDCIYVTNSLGDAGAGLKVLQNGIDGFESLINAHYHPEPNPEEGEWLASHEGVHAMMDISDGLNCDLKRLLKASHSGALVEISKLPISKELKRFCHDHHSDPLMLALSGGEDYCLLLTIDKEEGEKIREAFYKKFGKPLTQIGSIVAKPGLSYQKEGRPIDITVTDFSHF